MAFPAGLQLITVTGQVAGLPDGTPASVTCRWGWLQGPTDGAFLAAGHEVVECDGDGEFSTQWPATNDPAWSPVGQTWSVTIVRGSQVIRGTLDLPYNGGAVDLADRFNPDGETEPGVTYALLATVDALDDRVVALEEAPGGTTPTWESITGKPATFPPSGHSHAVADVTGLQTALDALDGRVDELESAPGGGSTLVVKRATVTSGNLTLAVSVPWAAVAGGPSLVLPAAVGDYVEFQIVSALGGITVNFLDLAVLAGGNLVRFLSSGGAAAATEGAPPFYGDTGFERWGPTFEFVVEAGDLDGGNVTVVFATKGSGGGVVYANSDYPLRWRALNHGPATVS